MFTPNQEQVRRFFCDTWAKHCQGLPLEALETLAAGWIAEHPQWHAILSDPEQALQATYPEGAPESNPFLHLSMHLSISEQCSIDQPRGIRKAVKALARRHGDLHAAHHEVMECLGQMLADARSANRPPDGAAYLDCVQRRATRTAS